MNPQVRQQWDNADAYMPNVEEIIKWNAGEIIDVQIAGKEDDTKRATDMLVTVDSAAKIGVRVRATHYRDFTIRAKNGNAKTEIHKIAEGFPDFYCYVWLDRWGGDVTAWIFVDMEAFRDSAIMTTNYEIKMNKDGYTGFIFIPIEHLDAAGCILSRGGDIKERKESKQLRLFG